MYVINVYSIYTGQVAFSLESLQHYNFDYAQQVHYPHKAQQVRTLFIKTPRKCPLFRLYVSSDYIHVHIHV